MNNFTASNKYFAVVLGKGRKLYAIDTHALLGPEAPSFGMYDLRTGNEILWANPEEGRRELLAEFAAWRSLTPAPYETIARIEIHLDAEGDKTYYETCKDGTTDCYNTCNSKGEICYCCTSAESKEIQKELARWYSLTPAEQDAESAKFLAEEFKDTAESP